MNDVAAALPVASPAPRGASGPRQASGGDEFSGILAKGGHAAERRAAEADETMAAEGEEEAGGGEPDAKGAPDDTVPTRPETGSPIRRFGGLAALKLSLEALERRFGPVPEAEAGDGAGPVETGEEDQSVTDEETEAVAIALAPATLAAHLAPRQPRAERAEKAEPRSPAVAAPARSDADPEAEGATENRRDGLRPVAPTAVAARGGAEQGGENAGFRRGAGQESLSMRVAVVAETNNIATSPAQNSQTVASLASAIASDGEWSAAARELRSPASASETTAPGPVRDLRIQLNPASLGEVNARLRISGEQLMVEVRVENADALQRLSSEREAIVTALRGLGFKVDDVTIVQQQASPSNGQNTGGGREGGASNSLWQGSERDSPGQSGAGREGRNSDQGRQNSDAQAHRAGADAGGVYI